MRQVNPSEVQTRFGVNAGGQERDFNPKKLTSEEIARNVHAHPTLSEVVMEAAHGVEGSPIHI